MLLQQRWSGWTRTRRTRRDELIIDAISPPSRHCRYSGHPSRGLPAVAPLNRPTVARVQSPRASYGKQPPPVFMSGGWRGKRDSNPRLRPWQGRTLPLSYSRPRRLRSVPQPIQPKQHADCLPLLYNPIGLLPRRARLDCPLSEPFSLARSLIVQRRRISTRCPPMEYQDFDFRQSSDDTPVVKTSIDEPPAWPKLIAAGVLVIAVAVTGYLVFRNRGAAAPASAPAATPAPAPTDAASPLGADAAPIDLPPLDQSDDVVRGLVKELSSNPAVAAWLTTKNLIRN